MLPYAADFNTNKVDMFDGGFHSLGSFTDPSVHSQYPSFTSWQVEDIGGGPLCGEWYSALFGIRGGFRATEMRLKSHPTAGGGIGRGYSSLGRLSPRSYDRHVQSSSMGSS